MNQSPPATFSLRQRLGLILGPLLFIICWFFVELPGLSPEGQSVLACTLWIATWWITEAIPIEATSLLPILLFSLTGGADLETTTSAYGHRLIFLFLGGFVIALAIERWQLHRRIALRIVYLVGTASRRIVLGFMVATGFLSMWISNTATALMMMPIGLAVIRELLGNTADPSVAHQRLAKALMLGIAYAASIGGMATLIGTPPNLVFASVVEKLLGTEVTFARWFIFGMPFATGLMALGWWLLVRVVFRLTNDPLPGGRAAIHRQLRQLGPMTPEEKWVLAVFLFTAVAWITRSYLLNRIFPELDDTIIAILGAMFLFVLPCPSHPGQRLMDWSQAVKLPWGVLLLFGAGLALAGGFSSSGLAAWIGLQLQSLEVLPMLLLILAITTVVNFLTEITSNVATASMMLPIIAALAAALDIHPFGLMVPAILAASCAFMLPVATPPNAVVFSSGMVSMQDMVRAGFRLNLLSIVLITIYVCLLLPLLWDLDLGSYPAEMLRP
jgi:sodium-dependent dicarboxylate transporter 2/3/5